MKNRTTVLAIMAQLMGLVCFVQVASAGDSDARVAFDKASRQNGVGRASVQLLKRGTGPGNAAVADKLDSLVPVGTALGGAKSSGDANRVSVEGQTWSLLVSNAGTTVNFAERSDRGVVAVPRRLNDAALTSKATEFVTGSLAPTLQIDTAQLYVLKIRHEIHTTVSLASNSSEDVVASSEVIFGRKIDGVPVVGPGSKLSIRIAVDGSVIGFQADWPSLTRHQRSQNVVKLDAIVKRVSDRAHEGFGLVRPDRPRSCHSRGARRDL